MFKVDTLCILFINNTESHDMKHLIFDMIFAFLISTNDHIRSYPHSLFFQFCASSNTTNFQVSLFSKEYSLVEFGNRMDVHPNRDIQQFSLHYRFSRTQNQRGVGRELKGEDGSLCNKSTFYDK